MKTQGQYHATELSQKFCAGTAVGIVVRGSCFQLVQKMTDVKGNKKYSKALLPKDSKIFKDLIHQEKFIKNYRNALSTGIAILAMCFTNFLIDAPLTVFFTNRLNAKTMKNKGKEANNG